MKFWNFFCAQNRRQIRTKQPQIQKSVWNVCYWKPDQTNSKYDETWWQHTSRCLQTPQIGNTQIRGLVWSQFKNSSKHPFWTIFVTFGLKHLRIFFSTTSMTTPQGLTKTRLKNTQSEKKKQWKRLKNEGNTMKIQKTNTNETLLYFKKQQWNG